MASDYSDPLEERINPERVNYENGVLLDENDFKDEQTYFRGRLSRALAFLHGSGTVAGLEVLETEAQSNVIMVKPGLAIDPIGRLIELSVPYCLRAPEWFATQDEESLQESYTNRGVNAVVADLFIKFNICGRGMTPYLGGGNTEGTDAFTHERLLDGVTIEMKIRTEIPSVPDMTGSVSAHFHGLNDVSNLNVDDALQQIREHKYTTWEKWNEDMMNGEGDTRVLLSRIQLPSTQSPMAYDTNGQIVFDDSVRMLSFTTTELFWLINAMRGD